MSADDGPYEIRYSFALVATFPTPEPWKVNCMPTLDQQERAARQTSPRRGPLASCCWYHQGNWHIASELAIRLVQDAEHASVLPNQISDHVLAALDTLGIGDWTWQAVRSLVSTEPIYVGSGGIISSGGHRAHAMIEAGVRRTLTVE